MNTDRPSLAVIERPFLCTELDQAVFTMAFHKLGSNPVETPGNLPAVVGVLV